MKLRLTIFCITSMFLLAACETPKHSMQSKDLQTQTVEHQTGEEDMNREVEYALDVALDEKLKQDDVNPPEDRILYFDNESFALKEEDLDIVSRHAEFLKKNPQFILQLTGYTDKSGSQAFNKKLSQKRAHAVAQALIKMGVKLTQVVISGYGPVDGETHVDSNRKVEFEYNELYTATQ